MTTPLPSFSKRTSGPFGNTDRTKIPVFLIYECGAAVPAVAILLDALLRPEALRRARDMVAKYPANDVDVEMWKEINALLVDPPEALSVAVETFSSLTEPEVTAMAKEGLVMGTGLAELSDANEVEAGLGWICLETRTLYHAG